MKHFGILLASAAALALPAAAQVKISPGPDKIGIEINGKPFSDFYVAGKLPSYTYRGKTEEAVVTKPYLWPLRAASGTYITRMWPMEDVSAEASVQKDHPHQRGLWFAHDSVNKLDFWNNESSYTTPNRGKIVFKKLGAVKNGKKEGSLAADFDWTDLKDNVLLHEARVMTFHADPKLRIVDFDITLTAAQPVTFGDSKDGTFGLRLRPDIQEQGGSGHIVNADGLETEKAAWGKPSNWCDYYGTTKEGEALGVAILDNPENPHHPVRWHVRGYGLFAANPFGLAVFTRDKSQNGSMTLAPGQSLRYRYRVIIHSGDVKSADIAQLWQHYTSGK
ncbi:MAG TPA: PmoA family protein [Bryobacteraceae bacterium]|nr:PmoA family protein [Bryobacteraceae bacterium]